MLNYIAIREAIIPSLAAYIGKTVIMADQSAPKPAYPYVGCKVTTPYRPEPGQPAETRADIPSSDQRFAYDVEYTQQTQPNIILSLTAYDTDEEGAMELASKVRDWFNLAGYDHLKSAGIVVVECGAVQNRDTYLVDDYERRQGFDVTLRVRDTVKLIVPTIEDVDYTGTYN